MNRLVRKKILSCIMILGAVFSATSCAKESSKDDQVTTVSNVNTTTTASVTTTHENGNMLQQLPQLRLKLSVRFPIV